MINNDDVVGDSEVCQYRIRVQNTVIIVWKPVPAICEERQFGFGWRRLSKIIIKIVLLQRLTIT